MTRVILTSRSVDYLSSVHHDIPGVLLKMVALGRIDGYQIVSGEEILSAIQNVPREEPLVVVVADSLAVRNLEEAMLGIRSPRNTDLVRVRSEKGLVASAASAVMPENIVLPSDFLSTLDEVLRKFSSSPAKEQEELPPSPPPPPPPTLSAPSQLPSPPSTPDDSRPIETGLSTEQADTSGAKPTQRKGFLGIADIFRGRGRTAHTVEKEGGKSAPPVLQGEEKDGQAERKEERERTGRKVRVVPVMCSRVGISGATQDEYKKISASVDKIYQGAVAVARIPISTIGTALFPVIAIVNGRYIDDPSLARASAVVVVADETDYEQLSALPDVPTAVVSRKNLVGKVVKIACDIVEGRGCEL